MKTTGKTLLVSAIFLVSNIANADYLVYPQGKEGFGVNIPEPDEKCARDINNESYWYYKHVQNSYEYNGSNYTSHSFTVDLVYDGVRIDSGTKTITTSNLNRNVYTYEGSEYKLLSEGEYLYNEQVQVGSFPNYTVTTERYYQFCLHPL